MPRSCRSRLVYLSRMGEVDNLILSGLQRRFWYFCNTFEFWLGLMLPSIFPGDNATPEEIIEKA